MSFGIVKVKAFDKQGRYVESEYATSADMDELTVDLSETTEG